MFIEQFGRQPPTKISIHKMLLKLKSEIILRDLGKGNSRRKFTVRTPTNIASVRRSLEKGQDLLLEEIMSQYLSPHIIEPQDRS